MKLNERIIYIFLQFISFLSQKMNPQKRSNWAQKIGGFIYHYIPLRKSTALTNIDRAFPEKSKKWKHKILKNSYSFFMEQFLFFLGFPVSFEQSNIKVKNKNILDLGIEKKKGVLYVTGHFGFWECIIAWFGKNNYPLTGIAQRQKNKGAHKYFIKQREWSGIRHVFRKDSLDQMNSVLEEGGILGLVSDQDAKNRGVFVRFFNILSSTPKGAAIFYQQKGSAPIFGVCSKEGHNQFLIGFNEITCDNLTDTHSFTQAYSFLLEQEIRRHPEQYFWWHNRWKTMTPTS